METIKRTKISEIFDPALYGSTVCVKGWVRTRRGNKNVSFIALNDGSSIKNIQIVVDLAKFDEEQLKPITTGACIRVDGRLVASPGAGQGVETNTSTTTASSTSTHRSSRQATARVPAPCSR